MSEILILCHHTICDGLSLAYLVRDLLEHLGEPEKEVEILPNPVPISKDNLPEGLKLDRVTKFFINRINKSWNKERLNITQKDYESLNGAYWSNFTHRILPVELSEDETARLVKRCKEEETSVNSALTAAVAGALQSTVPKEPKLSATAVAGNLRDRLEHKPGEAMGFYAGAITPTSHITTRKGSGRMLEPSTRKSSPYIPTRSCSRRG